MSTVTATRTGRYNGYVRGKLGHGPDWSGGGQNQEPNLPTACSPFPAVTTPTEDTGDTKSEGGENKEEKTHTPSADVVVAEASKSKHMLLLLLLPGSGLCPSVFVRILYHARLIVTDSRSGDTFSVHTSAAPDGVCR